MVDQSSNCQYSQYFAAIAAAFGAVAFGTATSWSSPNGPATLNELEITNEQISWVGSTLTFGAGSMCILTGCLTNFFGRKTAMLFLVIPFTLGWALIIFAKNVSMLIIGRAVLGGASGAICVIVPMYIGEIAEKHNRGMLCSFFQLLSTVGTSIVHVIGGKFTTSQLSVICASIPLIFGILIFFCPESPVYLMQRNRPDDASKVLLRLRGKRYDPSIELTEIQEALEQQPQHWKQKQQEKEMDLWLRLQQQKNIFKSITVAMLRQTSVKALSISYGLFICQQMCGINILIFYTEDIFKSVKTQLNRDLSTALVGIVATFLAGMIVDRYGRRILLLTSQLGVTICTFSLGYYFYMKDSNANSVDHLNWLPISSLFSLIIAFSIGLGPIPWVILSELFAPKVKSLAVSISTSSSLTLAFIATKTHDNIKNVLGIGGSFWLCTSFSLLGIAFVYFVVPETKGKSLNDIQEMLNETENVRTDSKELAKPFGKNSDNRLEMKPLNYSNKIRKRLTL